jgi:hypothetical protein
MTITITKRQFRVILSALEKANQWELSLADAWTPPGFLKRPLPKEAKQAVKAAHVYQELCKELTLRSNIV